MSNVTFSDRVVIAERFVNHVNSFNKKSKFLIETDPLTFMAWLDSEGLLDASICRSKAIEYRFLKVLDNEMK